MIQSWRIQLIGELFWKSIGLIGGMRSLFYAYHQRGRRQGAAASLKVRDCLRDGDQQISVKQFQTEGTHGYRPKDWVIPGQH